MNSQTLRLAPRLHRPASGWDIALRYVTAYSCTLLAVAAAQMIIPNEIALMLGTLTILGLPVSLWLRHQEKRAGGTGWGRVLVNGAVFLLTILLTVYVLLFSAPDLFTSDLKQFFLQSSAGHIISLLMEVFLVFAACRSFAIVSDKDTVLCTVPSFSVLLLLIVVHKGSEVVLYFVLWAMASSVLLTLDHRADVRQMTMAYVPSALPGQGARVSARGLASVLGFSLMSAFVLSYTISNRGNEEGAPTESWITSLASRLTQLALDLPDVSVNGGPERQIDYSSGPALPTATSLWLVSVRASDDGRVLRPQYWRMFTLAQYDGRTWTQTVGSGRLVNREDLPYERWPLTPNYLSQVIGDSARTFSLSQLRSVERPGYDIARHAPASAKSANFGGSRLLVRQRILSMVPNTGYLPVLPSVTALRISETSRRSAVRVRPDSSIDIGVLRAEDGARVLSELSPQAEYGIKGQPPDLASARPNPAARLADRERVQYLQLPKTLPARVRAWAQTIAAPTKYPGESHYRRARRLMVAVQQRAVYTLRPPITPDNRDATEFFLFESRRGYCTYFAGALTVACRAVGIPARVVTGFTNPEWQPNGTEAVLREANAHAWTEIWVPNWGWATLDATPADDRGDNAPSWVENWQDIFSSTQATLLQWIRDNRGVVMAVSTLLLLALAGFVIKTRRGALQQFLGAHSSHRAAQQADATARRAIFVLYHKLSRKLSRRFRPASPWETPLEWVGEAQSVLQLRDASPLSRLTELYTRAKYSPHPLSNEDLVAARAAWEHLSWERQPVEKPENAPTRQMS